ncbi:hypothetical protein SASPL_145558 [Salvia splendens]|uniref:Sulfotransferase n=1 Tax=Salvia splendens TaxID=180675 RepID=A0A8X8Z891_SALSN|nr:flavonol 3-sulfotransferase-like [Salvia splendens]KAG6394967.1 hypothetical protein SASPL_145558 [Salvia splendens]
MTFRSNFHARDDDVLLASFPKTGTTWLMALSHSILKKDESRDPLTTTNPHSLVLTAEAEPLTDKVLFVKYEEIKSHPEREVLRIAELLGRPVAEGEEEEELL